MYGPSNRNAVNAPAKGIQRRFTALFWLLAALMAGCSSAQLAPITSYPTPVLTPPIPASPISAQNTAQLTRLRVLVDAIPEPIAALSFTADAQELVVVHALSGKLARWRVEDGTLLKLLDTGPVGVRAAALDGTGRRVATAAGVIAPALEAKLAVRLSGYRVFDTESGALLFDSNARRLFPLYLPVADVALSPDGHWLAEATSDSISVLESATGIRQKSLIISGGGDLGHPFQQTTAVLDASGEWAAFMADDGTVRLWAWRQPEAESRLYMGTHEPALALAIDPTHRYIAAVTTERLVMRRIGGWLANWLGRIDAPVAAGPAAGLAFSPDGALLAVGTAAGWQLWAASQRQLLLEDGTPAYAVTFSPDGRLLAIGSADGRVHLWSVPESESR